MSRKYRNYDGDLIYENDEGEIHREDGPAVTTARGHIYYYKNNKPHRLSGPALFNPDGSYYWYKEGILHCTTEAAVFEKGKYEYWIEGIRYSKEDFFSKINKQNVSNSLIRYEHLEI